MGANKIMLHYFSTDIIAEITNLYSATINDFGETEEEREYLHAEYDDAYLTERAEYQAEKWDDQADAFLNSDNPVIPWNLYGDIKNYLHVSESEYRETIKRLKSGEQSTWALYMRVQITDWFWKVFGTHDFIYNFQTELSEALYYMPKETVNY